MISTHTSLAGRDLLYPDLLPFIRISTHTSLAGRDSTYAHFETVFYNFYSHVPRGT